MSGRRGYPIGYVDLSFGGGFTDHRPGSPRRWALVPDRAIEASHVPPGRAAWLRHFATGAERRRLGGPGDRLTGVAFSPCGRLLAASGTDADIRLWTLADLLGAESRRGPGATNSTRMKTGDRDWGSRQHQAVSPCGSAMTPARKRITEYRAAEKRSGIPPGGRASVRAAWRRRLGRRRALPNADPHLRGAILRSGGPA